VLTCRVQWLLMETEAVMESEPEPAFFLALRHGDTVTVRKMLSTAGAQSWIDYLSDLGYTPLYITALLNYASITEQLIVAHCNIDLHREDGNTFGVDFCVGGESAKGLQAFLW
jgi:hypothetical protein